MVKPWRFVEALVAERIGVPVVARQGGRPVGFMILLAAPLSPEDQTVCGSFVAVNVFRFASAAGPPSRRRLSSAIRCAMRDAPASSPCP